MDDPEIRELVEERRRRRAKAAQAARVAGRSAPLAHLRELEARRADLPLLARVVEEKDAIAWAARRAAEEAANHYEQESNAIGHAIGLVMADLATRLTPAQTDAL